MASDILDDPDFPCRQRASLALIGPLLLGWVVGLAILAAVGLAWPLAMGLGFLLGTALALVPLLTATKLVEGQLGAVPADPSQDAVLFNIAESLCLVSGLPQPKLMLIDRPEAIALVYGLRPNHARICVSEGFFNLLSAVEQEAVIAHGLCRIHRGDVVGDTLAAKVCGFLLRPLGLGRSAGKLARWMNGSDALLAADLAAVRLTRYPPAQVSALELMQQQEGATMPIHLDHLQMLPKGGPAIFTHDRMGVLVEV